MCVISAMERMSTSFNPFMHARLYEANALREGMEETVSHLEEIYHVSSHNNIADICTRSESKLTNLQLDSEWQTDPR